MASNDEEIRVAITAQADQYNAAMAQVSADTEAMGAKVAEDAAAFNSAQQAKFDALMRLSTAFRASLTSNEALSEAEGALDQAMAAGAVSAQEYAAYVAQLDAAETEMAASAATATEAVNANTAALTLNGGVAREVGVLIGELARGNYTRLEGSTITLANRTGVLSKALSFILSPAGAVAAALAGAAYAAVKGAEDFDKFENVVQLTNGAVGLSAGELQTMADNISHATKDSSDAAIAVQKLGASGRFAGDELNQAATSAVEFAQATGMKIEQVTSLLVKMATNPKAPLDELTNSLHVLSAAQEQEVEDLLRTGDKAAAAGIEIQAFAARAQQAESQVASQTNGLVGYFKNLGHQIAEAGHDFAQLMNVSTGGGDAAAKLEVINRQISAIHSKVMMLNPGMALQLPILEHQRDELQKQLDIEKQQEQQVQRTAKQLQDMVPQKGSFEAMQKEGLGGLDLSGNLRQQLAAMEDAENISYQNREGFDREYWGYVLRNTKDGTQAHIEALQQVDQIQRSSDQQLEHSMEEQSRAAKEAQRQRVEAAKEASRQIVENFEMEREQAGAASLQRIQIDAQMQDRLAGLYGQNSEQYRRALQERLSDTKAYVSAVEQSEKQREQQEETSYKEGEQAAMQRVQEAFAHLQGIAAQKVALGQMTTEQQLALDQDYANREYQIDLAILERWRETFQDRPRVVATVNAQIETLERKHQQQLDAIDQKAAQKRMQDAEKYLQPITRAFNQSIAGMIQGTQTFKQGWDRMLQSILLSFIQTELQVVDKHLASEMAQTSATAAGTQSRITIQAAGAAESKTIDATTGKSQIGTAAATGAAKAYQAMVGIPYVGPIIAPIAAAVAFAGIEAFGGSISSAAGGWDRVPADGSMTELHKNEMVLPAHLAERVRGMTDQGDGGGSGDTHHHYHINAMDSRSFRDWARRNPHEVASAAQNARRKGY